MALVEVREVTKTFHDVAALNDVHLSVERGSIAALLGPNGAGKTTLVRIIATLVRPDAGHVSVAGFDAVAEPFDVRARIGLTGQYAGLDEVLTGRANLWLIGRLAGLNRHIARTRSERLLERFDLTAAADRAVRTYSGGMRRRVDLAASLMARPLLLILDEPTTGLDPQGRLQLWEAIRDLRAEGTTMLLTTQYLEEADQLADIVHVLHQGRMVASGTPEELKARTGSALVEARFDSNRAATMAAESLANKLSLAPGEARVDVERGRLTLIARNGVDSLLDVARILQTEGIAIVDLGLRQPSLDEAFLALTGPGVNGESAS